MKFKLLFVLVILFNLISNSQTISKTELMGEWETTNVIIVNEKEIPQKDAIKFMEDAFLGSKLNFKGNQVFRIKYSNKADDRIKELFKLDKTNWVIEDDLIKIGTKGNSFSLMNMTYQEQGDKIYFVLPMMSLEVKKLSSEKPSKPKWVKSKDKTPSRASVDFSKVKLIEKDIDESLIIAYNDAENPPLAKDCKASWVVEKKRECTSQYIAKHMTRKFNIDMLYKTNLTGKIKIMLSFVIDTEGKVINIKATGGPDNLNKHAIDVASLLPNFTPATEDGKPINVAYEMPLNFMIAE